MNRAARRTGTVVRRVYVCRGDVVGVGMGWNGAGGGEGSLIPRLHPSLHENLI